MDHLHAGGGASGAALEDVSTLRIFRMLNLLRLVRMLVAFLAYFTDGSFPQEAQFAGWAVAVVDPGMQQIIDELSGPVAVSNAAEWTYWGNGAFT